MEEHKDSAPVPGDRIPPNPALDQQVADPATGREQDTNEKSEEENNINKNTTKCAGYANLAFQADVKTGDNFKDNGNDSNGIELLKWNSIGEQKMSCADDKNSNDVKVIVGKADDVEGEEEAVVVTDDEDEGDGCVVFRMLELVKNAMWTHREFVKKICCVIVFLLFLAYSGYCLYRNWGSEGGYRLLLLVCFVLYLTLGYRLVKPVVRVVTSVHVQPQRVKFLRKVFRWACYVAGCGGAVAYIAIDIAPRQPRNLLALGGICSIVIIGFLISTNHRMVNWHAVFWGIVLQFYFAIFLLRSPVGRDLFKWIGDRVMEFIHYTDSGSRFIFGEAFMMHRFIFQNMPAVIFLNSIIALGYYYGAIQTVIATFGKFLAMCLGTSPLESVNAAANIFLGPTEAPLVIKPFIEKVTVSELFAVMTGGLASIAGSVLGTLASIGIPANHLLAANVMSAPAALAVAKLMCPQSRGDKILTGDSAYKIDFGAYSNALEAVSRAAVEAVKIVATICANILVFIALLQFADRTVEWFGDQAGVPHLTLSRLLSYLFYPLAYLTATDTEDVFVIGRLIGVKILTNTQLAYMQAAQIANNTLILTKYKELHPNGTWYYNGDDVILDAFNQTLTGGVMTERSLVLSTYILCGFSNFSAMGVTLGTLSALAPSRSRDVLRYLIRAGIAANLACILTGCVAGLVYI
ncbi:solute carrier family 28 member 3-like isoform X2 [Pomacea canaliculata]|uniref:solute carrier family 28 member 3-like isoform X2 n=1 Tax=Pomacea canaliculata TaxID=400727 RepID=UPI000D7275DD|nr:solute carrier family 28 member 3-like isoform X2 [Pomacea canaliculata]